MCVQYLFYRYKVTHYNIKFNVKIVLFFNNRVFWLFDEIKFDGMYVTV